MRTMCLILMAMSSMAFAVSRGFDTPLLVVPYDAPSDLRSRAANRGAWLCDGVDDEAEINAAISAAAGGNNPVVCLPGTYYVSSPILLRSHTEVVFCQGNRVRVRAGHRFDEAANQITLYSDTVPVATIVRNVGAVGTGDSNIVLRGLYLDAGQGQGDAAIYDPDEHHVGVLLDQCTDSVIEDCVVENLAYASTIDDYGRQIGICVTRSERIHVNRCRTDECGYEGIGLRGTNAYIKVSNCNGRGNRVHFAQAARWHGAVSGGDGQHDILFEGLYSEESIHSGTSDDGAIFHGRSDAPIYNSSMRGCQLESGITVSGEIYGCSFVGNVTPDLKIYGSYNGETVEDVILQGNIMCGTDSSPAILRINTSAAGATIRRIMVQGNTIRKGYVYVSDTAGQTATLQQLTFSGNQMTSISGGLRYPILLQVNGGSDIDTVSIVGNSLITPDRLTNCVGVRMCLESGSTGNIKKVSLLNNYIYSTNGAQLYTYAGSGTASDVSLICNVLDLYSNPVKGSDKLTRVALLNNVVLNSQSQINGAIDDVIYAGNVLTGITGFTANNPTNVCFGVNPSWKGGTGENGAWRLKQDDTDPDKMYIQKLISGTWTTAGTFDATP